MIAVPTPVTESKEPDLFCVKSSVYPGVTEDIVKPILEKSSGMKCGVDFKIGYSPERINPGDDAHGIGNITKIVSGMDEETTVVLSELYDLVTAVFKARDIQTAEAAKVIENIQRDLNIALMKWNFNVYYPGAGVGGHCLPVDPYYLVAKAEELRIHSKVITAGRAVNDYMPPACVRASGGCAQWVREGCGEFEDSGVGVFNARKGGAGFSIKRGGGN